MAIEAYPVGSNSGFSEESAIDSERDRLMVALGGRMKNFIVDPFDGGHFDISTSGTSLDVTIDTGATGKAFLGGHLVENDAAITITLDASSTNEIFLVVADAATGNAQVTHTSDGSTPAGQYVMKIWEAVTDAGGVTGTTDSRKYVPYRGKTEVDSITGRKIGSSQGNAIDSTGVFTVSVTYDHPYIDATDTVLVSLNSLTDTAAGFDYIRAKNYTTTGFDIEYKVGKTGAAGSTASFNWVTHGE